MVKTDEGVAPASATKQPVKTEVVTKESVKQSSVKESKVEEAPKTSVQSQKLIAALQKIYFDFDSYKLSDAARNSLAKNAEIMKEDRYDKVQIEGNCDELGSDEYNLALGERRAKAALQYLVTMGIPAERLSYISYGKEKPVDPGHNEAAWAKNRRDDFVIAR